MAANILAFCSYRSVDKARVQEITQRLVAAGIEPWWDTWDIQPGDSFVARINEGLHKSDVGLIFLSHRTQESPWVRSEIESLTRQAIEEKKPLFLVMLDADAPVPELLRTRSRLEARDVNALIEAIYQRVQKPSVAPPRWTHRDRQCHIMVHEVAPHRLQVQATLDARSLGAAQEVQLDADFYFSYQDFLRSTPHGSRVPAEDRISQRDRDLVRLGQAMGRAVLPGPIGTELATTLHEAQTTGDSLTLIFETAIPKLLAMPFEAARLADGRVLALEPGVRVLRRFTPATSTGIAPLPGPLRLLVAVGAPDEGQTANVMLDQEAELQTILDAVEPARQQGDAAVRILEVAHPREIQRALLAQDYHVLHISGHGRAGMIEMEDEDRRAVAMTAADLADAIRQSGRRVPLIVLASCLSGAGDSDTVSMAQGLLEHGMPLVLAMQSSVPDWYSTHLVGALYQHLSHMQLPLTSHAMALARHEVETERRQARAHGAARAALSGRVRHAVALLSGHGVSSVGARPAAGSTDSCLTTAGGDPGAAAVHRRSHWSPCRAASGATCAA